MTVAVGTLGLVHDSPLRECVDVQLDVHVVFEALLLGFLTANFYRGVRRGALRSGPALHQFSRNSSRWVYLMIYSVIGARELVAAAHFFLDGGPYDFDISAAAGSTAPGRPDDSLRDDCQTLLVCGLVALAAVRALAYALTRADRRAPAGRRPAARLHALIRQAIRAALSTAPPP